MKKIILSLLLLNILFVSAQNVPSYVPTNGLVGWWPFNSNANDESGNGNNGTVTDATLTNDQFGNSNSAYNFDFTGYSNGSLDDMIWVNHNNIFNVNQLTVSCWFKAESYDFSGNPGKSVIVNRYQNGYSSPHGEFWGISIENNSGNFFLRGWLVSSAQSGTSIYSNAPINLNQWYFAVITYDNNTFNLYIDGQLVSSATGSNLLNNSGTSGISMGVSNQANGYWHPFDGDIDDVGYWTRALSESEIQQLFSSCSTPISLNAISDQSICNGESVTLTANATVMPSDNLVITAAFDGPLSGGLPKGIELYVINDIADLSLYGVGSANNGGGSDGQEFTFPAVSATAGDYIYVASDSTQFNNWFGFNADHISSAVNVNGDDAIELFYNGAVLDVFGDINTDGTGQPWEYLDGWAYRNNSTGPDGSNFTLSNWSYSSPNALDGESNNATALTPIPIGTFVHNGLSTINTYNMDVTASSSMDYTFTGSFSGSDPVINVNLGDTLVFNVNAPGHPFWINTIQGTGSSNGVTVTNNGTSSGTITWVPTTAGTYYYNCEFHSMMTNSIVVNPAAITYAWDNGVTNGVPFTPTTSGDYIVVASGSPGCTATDTVSISVIPSPSANAGADQTVCENDTVVLSGSQIGIPYTYLWDNGVTDGVGFVPPIGVTNYVLTVIDANGCESTDQVTVTVNALPSVNAGADVSICNGDSTILNATGAQNYTWDNNLGSGATHTVTPSSTTTYEVSVTDGNGCFNNDQVTVTVNPIPAVSAGADQTVCEGDLVTLSGSGANTYNWDNGVTDGVSFNPTTTTTYTVTGTDANGCSANDDVIITVTPGPNVVAIAAADTVCVNWESILLTSSPAGGVFSGNGVTGDRFYPTVAGVGTHDIVYSYTDSITGCTGTDTITVVVLECTGLTDFNTITIDLYPNPTNGQFTLQMDRLVNGRVEITNNIGQVVINKIITGAIMQFDLSSENSRGVYFVKVYSEEGELLKLEKILYQ